MLHEPSQPLLPEGSSKTARQASFGSWGWVLEKKPGRAANLQFLFREVTRSSGCQQNLKSLSPNPRGSFPGLDMLQGFDLGIGCSQLGTTENLMCSVVIHRQVNILRLTAVVFGMEPYLRGQNCSCEAGGGLGRNTSCCSCRRGVCCWERHL